MRGPGKRLTAYLTTRIKPIETEDCASILFELANGATATSSVTLGASTDETRIRLVFEHLTATSDTAPYAPGSGTWIFTARDPEKQADVDACIANAQAEPVGFKGFFAEVAKAIRNEPSQAVTFEDGAASVELVTAIYTAARTRAWVDLPLPPNAPERKGWQP